MTDTKKKQCTIHCVSTRRFWKIYAEKYSGGMDSEEYEWMAIYWGTWMEAAREVIKNDQSIRGYRAYRRVEPFDLSDTKRKRKGFYVC